MSSGVRFEKMDGNGDVNSGQLLMDIKAISKALYLPRISAESLISQSRSHRSKSASKTRNGHSNSKKNLLEKEVGVNEKKSSIWNWKKPLQALSHIRNKKFNCTFYLHVHSVEGMASNFDGSSLCVHWRRKDNVFRTPPSKVSQGVAEFEETLIHKCTVYGQRYGPNHFAKYEERLFLLFVSVVGASGLDVGKHWVDLTRLLPPTLEELEDDKSSGKWTTTFKLSGRARGATLNVSFGYSLMGSFSTQLNDVRDAQMFTSIRNGPSVVSEVARLNPGERHGVLSQAGVDPNNTRRSFRRHSESVGISGPHQFRDQRPELSRSIKALYQKFDEVKMDDSKEFDSRVEDVQCSEVKHRVSCASSNEQPLTENDDIDFTVVDQGIETSVNVQLKSTDTAGTAIDTLAAEENHSLESEQKFSHTKIYCDTEENMHNHEDFVVGGADSVEAEEINAGSELHKPKEAESHHDGPMISDSFDVSNSNTNDTFPAMKTRKELGWSKSHRLVRSFSLDDLAEAVADEFMNMLGPESSPYAPSSDSEPGSPRERLLRQFELETAASGNYIFIDDAYEMETEAGCSNAFEHDTDTHDYLEDFRLTICQAPEKNMSRIPSLISRRKAKAVEELETEDLMKKWGLSETTFVYTPHRKSGGFGSPIYCSDEETSDLPSLGDGFGPIIQTRGGGFLRSISSSIFRAAKNNSRLIMQVTSQKVLPAELGSGFLEILQHLASLGVEDFSAQTSKLFPLENITGKTTQQVAWEAASVNESNKLARMASRKNSSASNQELNDSSEYASLEELAPLAMDNVEALLIEGLRIQSNMPSEEVPPSMPPCASGKVTCQDKLLSLSLPLDEWFRLDAGDLSNEEFRSRHNSRLLPAHNVKGIDLGKTCGDRKGLLGNKLMVALRVQLRDPFRHFEAVGSPMLVVIHVNRVYVSREPKTNLSVFGTNDESIGIESKPSAALATECGWEYPDFRITEVHVAGINSETHKKSLWASTSQQQYGSRWLMSSGMNKTSNSNMCHKSSKEMVRYTSPTMNKTSPRDKLWSISFSTPETATNLEHLHPSNSFIRNPDFIFSN